MMNSEIYEHVHLHASCPLLLSLQKNVVTTRLTFDDGHLKETHAIKDVKEVRR
jgi:hypothetical protein